MTSIGIGKNGVEYGKRLDPARLPGAKQTFVALTSWSSNVLVRTTCTSSSCSMQANILVTPRLTKSLRRLSFRHSWAVVRRL
jgi:hypothetical protein